MEIIDRGTVFAGQENTNRQSCAFPQICVLPGGRWLCSFRAAPTKAATTGQSAVLSWSDDEGRSWSRPVEPFVPLLVDGKPGLFRSAVLSALGDRQVLAAVCWVDHSEPALPFFNEQTEGLLDTRIFLARSDDGATWSQPELMDTSPFNVPTPLTGPVLQLPDGRLACHFELNKHYNDTSTWRHSSVIMFSADGGKTWPEHTVSSNDPENRIFYWDQRPAVLGKECILDLFWTYDNRAAVYLNIHARESLDLGRTWSAIWDTGVPGQPAAPVPLSDGRIGMVYVDRSGAPAIKMRSSHDGGRTWPDASEIVLYTSAAESQTWDKGRMQDAWAEMGKFSVGLPATATLPDGDVLAVYYAGPHTDRTGIHWVRIGENQ